MFSFRESGNDDPFPHEMGMSYGRARWAEEAVAGDIRSDSLGDVALAQIPSPSSHGGDEEEAQPGGSDTDVAASAADTTSALSNLTVEKATLLFSQTGSAVMQLGQNLLSASPLWQGYIFESVGFGFPWRLVFSFLRYVLNRLESTCARWKRVVARVQTTLRGSGDEIGWLQKAPGLPPVEDGTARFMHHLGQIMSGVHVLPTDLVYLLVPGLFSNHGPLYFVDTKKYFSKLGLACHIAKIHSEAGVETNAQQLKDNIEELFWGTGKRVVLLGHSKGGVDSAAALSMYWGDLRDKVVGLVAVQSPYGGSPIASDILREGQIADIETRRIMEMLICKIIKGDMRALEDLTYQKRREFLEKYSLPPEFPTISFHTEASKAPGVVSTLSQIAHAEFPWLPGSSGPDGGATKTLPVVIPLAAAMAVCALHLELRYGEKSDGLVARKDAEIPGSVVVRPEKKLDHAWMVYSPAKKDVTEADSAQMCEALLALLMEVSEERQDRALRTLLAS